MRGNTKRINAASQLTKLSLSLFLFRVIESARRSPGKSSSWLFCKAKHGDATSPPIILVVVDVIVKHRRQFDGAARYIRVIFAIITLYRGIISKRDYRKNIPTLPAPAACPRVLKEGRRGGRNYKRRWSKRKGRRTRYLGREGEGGGGKGEERRGEDERIVSRGLADADAKLLPFPLFLLPLFPPGPPTLNMSQVYN